MIQKRLWYAIVILYALSALFAAYIVVRRPSVRGEDRVSGSVLAKDTVAVIRIYGPIYVSQSPSRFGVSRDADGIVRRLHRLSRDPNVKAVVLRINSPGGSIAATQEIAREIDLLRANGKIVVASMGDIAASGGYYVACHADRIVALPGTLTGSIGVIMQTANVQELLKKVGVRVEAVMSGKHKDIASPFRELSDEERAMIQALIDTGYGQFVDAVAKGRKMDRAKVLELADGRIFIGSQARELGLIDELGNSEQAIETAARMAKLKNPRVVYDADTQSLGQLLQLFGESAGAGLLSGVLPDKALRLDYMAEELR